MATGTGIAPYRSFIRRLFVEKTPFGEAYKGLAWLFLGVANSDALLYDDEWQEVLKKYPNSRCDLSVRQIAEALDHIPRRVAGQGTYGTYLRILWGLKAAITEAGGDEELAIRLMEAHSPSEVSGWDVAQVARSGGKHIGPGTFFHHAKQYGWSRHAKP